MTEVGYTYERNIIQWKVLFLDDSVSKITKFTILPITFLGYELKHCENYGIQINL